MPEKPDIEGEYNMNILITGARGMVGSALAHNLEAIRDGKNRTRPGLCVENVYLYDIQNTQAELEEFCRAADFVFHFAGVNRPKDVSEFTTGNVGALETVLAALRAAGNRACVMVSSSTQASLCGRFAGSDYGKSKLAEEETAFRYSAEAGVPVAVYRFPNLMGPSRPNYNSAVSTFCYQAANGLPLTVNDRSVELELLYIDDLVEGMLDLLEGKERRCEYDGLTVIENPNGRYRFVPGTHRVTLGEIADLLAEFQSQPLILLMPRMPEGSFEKKLFSLYLRYLPADKVKYALKMNRDARGSFTELMKTADCGQVSVNITRPGVTKGQHWHNSKWEQFIVVHGHGLIRERNLNTGEILEFEVSGERIESVYMLPGWTHSITNLSETEDLVTVMTCNETFNPNHPDTFAEPV